MPCRGKRVVDQTTAECTEGTTGARRGRTGVARYSRAGPNDRCLAVLSRNVAIDDQRRMIEVRFANIDQRGTFERRVLLDSRKFRCGEKSVRRASVEDALAADDERHAIPATR
jgi:hypothetical protein